MAIATAPAVSQAPVEVQTRDGRVFFADSVQFRGSRVVITPRGLGPIEMLASDIRCYGDACKGAPIDRGAPRLSQRGQLSIQGSNTIGATLMPALIRKYGEIALNGKVEVEYGNPEEQRFNIVVGERPKLTINLESKGSDTAFAGLQNGSASIGMASRSIKPDEARGLQQRIGVDMLGADSEHVLALDGIAIVINPSNPLRDAAFDNEMLGRIFSGEISDWKDIGGSPGTITIHARDIKSGTFSTFNDLVLKPYGKTLAPLATRYESSDDLASAIEADRNAIGFIGLSYIGNNRAVSIGSSCGIVHAPSHFTVKSEVYPLSRRLYLYTAGAPGDEDTRTLLSFALSDRAQPIIREAGAVDQTIEFEDRQLRAKWLADLDRAWDRKVPRKLIQSISQLVGNTKRASVQFRFRTGSAELDTKALADTIRLAAFLRQPEVRNKKWLLIGMADSDGSFRKNEILGRERAEAVAGVLRKAGVGVDDSRLLSLSWLAPVACNDNERGKALNRRVEVWIEE